MLEQAQADLASSGNVALVEGVGRRPSSPREMRPFPFARNPDAETVTGELPAGRRRRRLRLIGRKDEGREHPVRLGDRFLVRRIVRARDDRDQVGMTRDGDAPACGGDEAAGASEAGRRRAEVGAFELEGSGPAELSLCRPRSRTLT
jgi:hypothetical protein